jgi:phosphatidate phosphatase PAH1
MTELNYFKQFETEGKEEINIINSNETKPEQETEIKIKTRQPRLTNEQRKQKREKKNEYLKSYYEDNKDKILEKAKENSRTTYGRRIVRELNNNMKDISTVKAETLEKWNIKYNSKTKLYYIDD